MQPLIALQALELGDAVCLFPEGISRYHPAMSPLKTGGMLSTEYSLLELKFSLVARIVSDTLSRNRNNPDFSVSILNCSITYTHRQHWRSDVLVTFHKPMQFTPKVKHLLVDIRSDVDKFRIIPNCSVLQTTMK